MFCISTQTSNETEKEPARDAPSPAIAEELLEDGQLEHRKEGARDEEKKTSIAQGTVRAAHVAKEDSETSFAVPQPRPPAGYLALVSSVFLF